MQWFALALVVSVPVLYGLFWWLDYRWLEHVRGHELSPPPEDEDEERAF